MFNFFDRSNNEVTGLNSLYENIASAILEEEAAPAEPQLATVIETNTTKISVVVEGISIDIEQTNTTTTIAPVEAFLTDDEDDEDEDNEDGERLYFIDIQFVDTFFTRGILLDAIGAYCVENYANAEVLHQDGPIVTVRFTSPLMSSIMKMATVVGKTEDDVVTLFL